MGRPLPKRFFGNQNTGSASTTADNGIGGDSLASISNGTVGAIQINNTHKTFPLLTVAAPTIPGGVTATTSVVWEIATIVVSSGGTGYTINQTGAAVTSVTGLYTQASVVPVLTLDTNGTGNVTAVNITGSSRGEFTSIDGTGITTWAVVGAGGTNAQITVTFRVKSIAVVEAGSGYVAAPSLSWSQVNGGTMPSAQTPTLNPTESGTPYTSSAFATIRCTAQTTTGGSALEGDIISQRGSRKYRVITSNGTAVCNLVAATPSAAGEMSIVATDYSGNTYYVTKLTRHRVLLTRNTGSTYEFATNSSAAWTTDTLVAGDTGITVLIANK